MVSAIGKPLPKGLWFASCNQAMACWTDSLVLQDKCDSSPHFSRSRTLTGLSALRRRDCLCPCHPCRDRSSNSQVHCKTEALPRRGAAVLDPPSRGMGARLRGANAAHVHICSSTARLRTQDQLGFFPFGAKGVEGGAQLKRSILPSRAGHPLHQENRRHQFSLSRRTRVRAG